MTDTITTPSNEKQLPRGSVQIGYRFRLKRLVDRWPDFLAPEGLTGTVTIVDDEGIWGKMDQHIPGAEEWENQIHWYPPLHPDDFPDDTEALMTLAPPARLTELTDRLNAYCDLHGLPHDSADELAVRDDTPIEQRAWLNAFIEEWDAAA